MQKSAFPFVFPHVAWGNDGAGACAAPVPPAAGPSALHPLCEAENLYFKLLSARNLGNEKRAHGRNENVEKSRSGKCTFLPVFSHFPRMQSIRSAVFHTAQPVARSAGTQFAKIHFSSAKGVLRERAPVAHPIRKKRVRVPLFHRNIVCKIHIAISGTWSRVNDPGGVQGQSPAWFPKQHRETVCLIQIVISGERVQG